MKKTCLLCLLLAGLCFSEGWHFPYLVILDMHSEGVPGETVQDFNDLLRANLVFYTKCRIIKESVISDALSMRGVSTDECFTVDCISSLRPYLHYEYILYGLIKKAGQGLALEVSVYNLRAQAVAFSHRKVLGASEPLSGHFEELAIQVGAALDQMNAQRTPIKAEEGQEVNPQALASDETKKKKRKISSRMQEMHPAAWAMMGVFVAGSASLVAAFR